MVLELGFKIPLENHVLLQRIIQNQSVFMTILGNVAHAELTALPNGGFCNIMTAQGYFSLLGLLKSRKGIDQLGLTVSFDSGKTDDLAPPYFKGDTLYGVIIMPGTGHDKVFHLQDHLPGFTLLFLYLKGHITAHHHAGQLLLRRVRDVHGTHVFALPKNGAAVGHSHDLRQLMGNEENTLSLIFKAAHDLHQFVDFLRRKHSRRLIEDQDLVVAVQHFQNFNSLLHTYGNVRNIGIRIHLQAILLRQSHHLLTGSVILKETVFCILHPQNDVIQDRKAFHQLKVLMDHSDSQTVCIVGILDLNLLAVFLDHALFRLVKPEQNTHQRTLSGSVLTQQRMDLSFFQLQSDVVIGLDPGKLLCDVKHFNNILFCQIRTPFRIIGYR